MGISIIKTIIFNFKAFGSFKWRFLIGRHTKIESWPRKNQIDIIERKRVFFGVGKGSFGGGYNNYFRIGNKAHLVFTGNAYFSRGIKLICDGEMVFGKGFSCNYDCLLNCRNSIMLGDDLLLGWRISILDGDGHSVNNKAPFGEISIGNHVWICSETVILKNVHIQDNSVVSCGSVVKKLVAEQNNVLIEGNPAKIICGNIGWRK